MKRTSGDMLEQKGALLQEGLLRQKFKKGVFEMIYRSFQDLRLSGLGLGMMRLPTLEGNDAQIDETLT